MSSRRDTDRLRPRRPRVIADDFSDSDPSDYDNRPRRSGRARPPPEELGRRIPPAPADDAQSLGAPLHTRARSKVRLKEPSVISSDSDTPARRRDPRSRRTRTDLERKLSPEQQMFRSRRDGYLSDEGEALKKSRRAPRPRREPDFSESDGRDRYRRDRLDPGLVAAGGAGAAAGAALSSRRNARAKSMEAPYPDDPYEAPPRRSRRPEYDTDPDGPPRRRGAPRRDPRPRYDDYYDEPSPPRRRGEGQRSSRPIYDEPERGYRSDHGGRRRGDPYGYPERDPYDRRARGDGYRSDHGPSRYDAYDDPRASRRDPRRDPYDDRRDRARSSARSGKKKGMLGGLKLDDNWQKGATDAFLMYGLPILKKEGPKWAKQAQNYWVKRGGM